VGVYDLFGGEDFLELTVVGSPAHPLGFCDVIPDAAGRSELAPQLEGTPQSPFMGRFALAGVCEPVSLARGEGEGAVR
jgi:hypothetical protein